MASLPQPHLQLVKPDQWISAEDFLRLSGWQDRWLRDQVSKGNVRSRDTGQNGRNGKPVKEYAVASLPPKARADFEAQQAPAPAPTLFGPVTPALSPRVAVSAAAEQEMKARLDILYPILDFLKDKAKYKNLRLEDGTKVSNLTQIIRFVSEARTRSGKPISEETLWRWLRRHREGGEAELAKRSRKDAGFSHTFAEPKYQDAAALVASLYLGDGYIPGVSVQACHKALTEQAALVGLTPDEVPSYFTVRRFLMQTSESLKTYARKGKKRFGESILPYVTRAYSEHANQIWVSDHAIMDVEVINDVFFGDAKLPIGRAFRLRFSCVIDYRSRYVVGFSWAAEESSYSIGSAIRDAVLKHGPAEHFYCDNGKAYLKTAKGAQPGWLQQSGPADWWAEEMERLDVQMGILGRLGMKVTHCIVHHPQSKHVERFFRTLHAQVCSLFPTYTGGSPDRRPDATAALMQLHRKAERRGQLQMSMHPTASQLMAVVAAWLDEYHNTPHSGKGMDGRTPAQCFAEERNPAQRPAPSPEEMAVLFYDRTTRKIDSCAITLGNRRYVAADPVAVSRMAARNGHTITVAYSRSTPEQVAVLTDDGRVLCLLQQDVPLAFAPDDTATKAAISATMQQRGQLTREVREEHQAITRRARRIGVASNVELLARKALPGTIQPEQITQPRPPRKPAAKTAAPLYPHEVGSFIAALED